MPESKSKPRKYIGKVIVLSFLNQPFQTVVRGPRGIYQRLYGEGP